MSSEIDAIVLGIEAPGGTRGILMDAYGPYASFEVGEILARMPKKQTTERQAAVGQLSRLL